MEGIFISGINGFIGYHLANYLQANGYRVVGIGRDQKCRLLSVEYYQDDCSSSERLKKYAASCTCFIHLAATTTHDAIVKDPLVTVELNSVTTLAMLKAFASLSARHFFYASSGKVYGRSLVWPMSDDAPCLPQSILGKYKYLVEHLIEFAAQLQPSKIFSVGRIFNVYGHGQKESFLIPTVLRQVYAGEEVIKLGDVNAKRDYIYVADVVSAIGTLIAKSSPSGNSVSYNIGTGVPSSARDIVQCLSEIVKRKLVVYGDVSRERPDEGAIEYCLYDRLQQLGWQPRFSLRAGLSELIKA